MTTASWSAVFAQTTAAQFRAIGGRSQAHLAAIGLVQTTDTGQIDWTTVAAPTTSAQSMGYEIWRFNDALQATAPIFFKIEFGSAGPADHPSIWLTVGTGSNGAGTITNIGAARRHLKHDGPAGPTGTAYPNYLCHVEGFLGVVLRVGYANVNTECSFIICRYSNDDGTPNGDGYVRARHVEQPGHGYGHAAGFCQSFAPLHRQRSLFTIGRLRTAAAHSRCGRTAPPAAARSRAASFRPCRSGIRQEVPAGVRHVRGSPDRTRTRQHEDVCVERSTPRTFIGLGRGMGYGGLGADSAHAMLWE